MVVSCVASECPNRFAPQKNISYFHFPNPSKYPQLHNVWLQAIDRHDLKATKNSFVCELHFNEDDFDETYKMKKKYMPCEYFRPILKPDAVPKLRVQNSDNIESDEAERMKILAELLGESYLNWKYRGPYKIPKKEKEECVGNKVEEESRISERTWNLSAKEKLEEEQKQNRNRLFDITTDYILKIPLKPLPAALQRALPSILKVIIKGAPGPSPRNPKLTTISNLFSCSIEIHSDQFYCCESCRFSTCRKVGLLQHAKLAHLPVGGVGGAWRQPMKINKLKEATHYWCEKCSFGTFSRLLFLKHAHERGEFDLLKEVEGKWSVCAYCLYRCRKRDELDRHVVNKHRDVFRVRQICL